MLRAVTPKFCQSSCHNPCHTPGFTLAEAIFAQSAKREGRGAKSYFLGTLSAIGPERDKAMGKKRPAFIS
jgi:hypothetical protein